MKTPALLLRLAVVMLSYAFGPLVRAGEADYKPELFQRTKLIYADTFDSPLNAAFWEVRQNTTWAIKDGVLTGGASSKEFQDKKKSSADPSHAGVKPVIWLKQ